MQSRMCPVHPIRTREEAMFAALGAKDHKPRMTGKADFSFHFPGRDRGMEEPEFLQELAKYPKVRNSTWTAADNKSRASSSPAAGATESKDVSWEPAHRPWFLLTEMVQTVQAADTKAYQEFQGPFFDALSNYLRQHMDDALADKVVERYQRNYKRNFGKLSLDGMGLPVLALHKPLCFSCSLNLWRVSPIRFGRADVALLCLKSDPLLVPYVQ